MFVQVCGPANKCIEPPSGGGTTAAPGFVTDAKCRKDGDCQSGACCGSFLWWGKR